MMKLLHVSDHVVTHRFFIIIMELLHVSHIFNTQRYFSIITMESLHVTWLRPFHHPYFIILLDLLHVSDHFVHVVTHNIYILYL